MWSAIALLAVLLLWLAWSSLAEKRVELAQADVEITTVRRATFAPSISAPATVEAVRNVVLTASEGGAVVEVLRQAGERVQAGDVVVRLSNPQLARELAEAETKFQDSIMDLMSLEDQARDRAIAARGALAQAQRDVRKAEAEYDRQKILADKGIVSRAKIDSLRDDMIYAKSALETARAADREQARQAQDRAARTEGVRRLLEQNRLLQEGRRGSLEVRSTISGILSGLEVGIGAAVTSNQAIARVDDDTTLRLVAKVPASLRSELAIGQRASVDGTERVSAVVQSIDSTVINDEVRVVLSIDPSSMHDLRIGQNLTVVIRTGRSHEAVVVDSGDLIGPSTAFVVARGGGTARRQPITLGARSAGASEVRSGLKPGDRVVRSAARPVDDATVLDIR